MSLYHRIALYLFPITLVCLAIYSYALIDPNLTLFNNDLWTNFRNTMVELGYHQRTYSCWIYLSLLASLFFTHIVFVREFKQISLKYLGFLLLFSSVFSYMFLSHDFFNYIFDAKIFTHYHMNPYLHKALDFPWDDWLRFMHWTHRTYPYGPTFLPLSFIPSFVAFGKLLPNIILFKLFFFSFFWTSVVLLSKIDKRWAVFYATNPLVLIEGLINGHNDIVGLSLAIIGCYFIVKNKKVQGWSMLIISGGIKYITAPLILLTKKESIFTKISFILTVCILIYLSVYSEVQGWYFLVLFAFLPYYGQTLQKLNILFAGLLVAYYPYISDANWTPQAVNTKHIVIVISLGGFIFYLAKDIVFKHMKFRS